MTSTGGDNGWISGIASRIHRHHGTWQNLTCLLIDMNPVRFICYLLAITFLAETGAFAYLGGKSESKRAPDQIIIKTSSEITTGFSAGKTGIVRTGQESLDRLNREYGVRSMVPILGKQSAEYRKEPLGGVYVLRVEPGESAEVMAQAYRRLGSVEYAEPDYEVEFYLSTDDPFANHQWGLENTGQGHYYIERRPEFGDDKLLIAYGLPGADLKAAGIVNNPPDGSRVVVAIIDTGVDLGHPDLQGSIWFNPREIAGNGIDDDNNGYIDDINGWDFAASNDPLEIGSEDNDPTDEFGHGTHCAGIVAAQTGNTVGIAGLMSRAEIMALKVLPVPLTSKIARAIVYAADNGADVISMSFGMPYRSYVLEEAIDYARSKGVVLLAASGNGGIEEANYPSALDSVISVGATNDSDRVAYFTSYGDYLDICAPGLSILSLRADSTDMYDDEDPEVHIIAGQYYLSSGTSMACPMAAGAAAWLRSLSPGLTPAKTEQVLESTAYDYTDPFGSGLNVPGWDKYSGYGRVDVEAAIAAVPSVRAIISTPMPYKIVSGTVEVTGTADGVDFGGYVLEYGAGTNPETWTPIANETIPASDGLLGLWDVSALTGKYTLRLRVGEYNVCYRTVFVANGAVAEMVTPLEGDTVSNIIGITVNAYSPSFSYLLIEYTEDTVPEIWQKIAKVSVPACGDPVSDWMVAGLPEGNYRLRVSVYGVNKYEIADEISVYVQSNFSGSSAWKAGLYGAGSITATYADLDADGYNEIIVGTSNGIRIFNTDGTPQTDHIATYIQNNFQIPIAVGRLDDDGIEDFVAMGTNPEAIYGFPSKDPHFVNVIGETGEVSKFSNAEHEFSKIFLRDIDYDGLDEINVVVNNNEFSKVRVYESDGTFLKSYNSVSEYLPADLNDDGFYEFYAYFENDFVLRQFTPSGQLTRTFSREINGSPFKCVGLAACNIDADYRPELIAYAVHPGEGYWLYAFDDGLNLKSGWPHDLSLDDYLVPTMPVFGDINGDNIPEYINTSFDLSVSYVHVWNIDGTSFIPGNPDGLFATIPRPGVLNMPVLADVNGDGKTDILACANDDLFYTFKVQRIYAWDYTGNLLPGFPFVTVPTVPYNYSSSFRFTPAIGDIKPDGKLDMLMPTSDSAVILVDFAPVPYDSCQVRVPSWRYNRRLDNIQDDPDCIVTDGGEDDSVIPDEFGLSQNFPNPFNMSTTIRFSVPKRMHVKIGVFNILGQEIRTLADRVFGTGDYDLEWDGTDRTGNEAASGVYFYSLKAGGKSESRKMILMK